ncbi:MAG: hypothetical protein KBS81_08370, partial [Spirochaetales bacterium]|nr:hypothetical protein [Candidatus Physcosoma equi]
MGWFDEQVRNRREADDELFSAAFMKMNDAVLGTRLSKLLNSDRDKAKDAIDGILKFYHVKSRELPDSIKDVESQLEYLLRPSGIMRRTVTLSKGWEKDAIGAMLATTVEGGKVVALIPEGSSGYWFLDDTGKKTRVTPKNEGLFSSEALAFYKPFPLKKLSTKDLLAFAFGSLGTADYALYALALFSVSLIGLGVPKLNNLLFSSVLESGSLNALFGVGFFFVSLLIAQALMGVVQNMYLSRIETKMELSVQAATMMRVLTLPA